MGLLAVSEDMNTLREVNVLLPVDDVLLAKGVLPVASCLLGDGDNSQVNLIDSNSTDFTRRIATGLGVVPYVHHETLSRLGSFRGKGEALWKSLYLLKGDLILWMDTDIINPHPRLVYGIIGPLLMDRKIQYVKGFYRRSATSNGDAPPSGGGRVTELVARPMINLFFPELSASSSPCLDNHSF